jgi:hypothetical protein
MDPELLIVLLIVSVAALYLGRKTLRTWRGKGSCCSKGCGSGKKSDARPPLIPSEQLTLRIRR